MPFDIKRKLSANIKFTNATDFHPTHPWLLVGSHSGGVTIYNLESGKVVHAFTFKPSPVWCVKFIARKNWYVVGLQNGWLRVFDCDTHEEVVNLKAHYYWIRCLAVHPTKPIVLTGSDDTTIKVWDWDNQWHKIHTYNIHPDRVYSIAFNPKDPNMFAAARSDGSINIWSIDSLISTFTINTHNQCVRCVDFYPGADKPYLVTACDDKTVKVWDYLSQSCVQTLEGYMGVVKFAVFHPNLPIIITGSNDGSVKIWNSETYELEHTFNYQLGMAKCIALRKDTSEVAVGFDQAIRTLELAHSGSFQTAVSRGNIRGETPKEEVPRDPEHQLELAQSLDSLTTALDTVLSPSTAPSQPHSHKMNPYKRCTTLAMKLITTKTANKLISELGNDKAQRMVDFLSKMINGNKSFPRRNRKLTLHLLSKLAKSAQVFPQALELQDVRCKLTDPVAAGGYGFIYQGKHEGRTVCIKAVRVDSRGVNKQKMRAHAGELIIWAHLFHPNVLPFLGIYPSKEQVSRICIVSPWMHNGDLLEYLSMVSDAPRKPLVRDIILGLQYLHDLDIIHADLKAKNVLVSENGRAMLADFGISRLSVTLTMTSANVLTGTAYWMAPELHLDDEPSSSRETDIWAFACTCYEIITGMAPFNQYRNPVMLMGAFMRGKIIPVKPENPGIGWDEDIWSIAMRCWQRDPGSRPKVHELLDTINSFDFLDDRPLDSQYTKSKSSVTIDYTRILGILDEIHQSVTV